MLGEKRDNVVHSQMRVKVAVLLLALVLFTAACGTVANNPPGSATPLSAFDSVQVTRLGANPFPPFAPRTIADSASVQRLYAAMLALPHLGTHASCPPDDTLHYILLFSLHGSDSTTQVFVAPSGCPWTRGAYVFRLPNNDYRQPNQAFWALFARILGVSEADLFPTPSA